MNNRIKQVHFVHMSATPGGIEVLFPSIIHNMHEFSFSAFVIRPPVLASSSIYNEINIQVNRGSCNNLASYYKLAFYGLKNRSDIFHLFNAGPIYLLILRFCGVKKIVYSIHGTKYWKKPYKKGVLRFLWKLALSRKTVITSNSVYSKSVFNNEISKFAQIQVHYNPIDTSVYKHIENDKDRKLLKIVYAGRLAKGKGLEKWIRIAVALHKAFPNTYFEIWGDGDLKPNIGLIINTANADSFIKLCGFTKQLEKVFQNSDLLLFLSEYESFGNVAVESILCGTPVIAADIPSMREIFVNYPDFIVRQDDKLELNIAEKIRKLNKLKELALIAAEEFRNRFSIEQHIEQLSKIYASFDK